MGLANAQPERLLRGRHADQMHVLCEAHDYVKQTPILPAIPR